VKNFVHNPNPNRIREEEDDGPTPTQRATGSLQAVCSYLLLETFPFADRAYLQLVAFAESATLCRHVVGSTVFGKNVIDSKRFQSICRYFDEPIDETNQELVKTYCNRMCDVGVSRWKPIS
jgi:bloom syndrome protein